MKTRNLFLQSLIVVMLLGLIACSAKQETDYEMHSNALPGAIIGGTAGLAIGAAANGNVVPLAILGGVAVGSLLGYLNDTQYAVVNRLQQAGVQVIEVGDYLTLVLPSDHFFDIDSARIDPETNWILRDVVRVLRAVDHTPILIAAYTDNVGVPRRKREVSQAQAEAMKSFFWAHGIDFHRLHAIGYGEDYPIGSNRSVIGSAMNRRVEIRLARTPDLVVKSGVVVKNGG